MTTTTAETIAKIAGSGIAVAFWCILRFAQGRRPREYGEVLQIWEAPGEVPEPEARAVPTADRRGVVDWDAEIRRRG